MSTCATLAKVRQAGQRFLQLQHQYLAGRGWIKVPGWESWEWRKGGLTAATAAQAMRIEEASFRAHLASAPCPIFTPAGRFRV